MGKILNSFYRLIGIMPGDDFDEFQVSVYNILDSFDKVKKRNDKFQTDVKTFAKVVGKRLDINSIDEKEDKKRKKDNIDRGMFL